MDIEKLTQSLRTVDLSRQSFEPVNGEKIIHWHLFDLDLSPVNIMSRVNWHSQTIRLTDGKTLCFLSLKYIRDFQFKTGSSSIWEHLYPGMTVADRPHTSLKIDYIRKFFMNSGVFKSETGGPSMFQITPDMPEAIQALCPEHFIVLPLCEMDGNMHIALVNRDFAFSKYLSSTKSPGVVARYTLAIDMAYGIRTHMSISGRPYGSSLNFFTAAQEYYKRNPCMHYLELAGCSYPVPISQLLVTAAPYFPELQIIWVSNSIALTPGVDSMLFRFSAHLKHIEDRVEPGPGILAICQPNPRLNALRAKVPNRIERRQAQYEAMFKKYKVQDGAACHVSNFNKMIFSLHSHAGRKTNNNKWQDERQSFLDKKLQDLAID